MERSDKPSATWSSTQVYGLAIACLILGLVAGYLLYPLKPVSAGTVPKPNATIAVNGMPTAEQLQHMADKKAEPLLAALQNDPGNVKLLTDIGNIYFQARQFPMAAKYYERAEKSGPNADVLVSLASAYYYAGAGSDAIATLDRALAVDPKSANALYNLGMLRWQVNDDPQGAVQAWQRLLKSNPKHPRRQEVETMIARARKHLSLSASAKNGSPSRD